MQARPLRLPVQWVNRTSSDFRGYAGLLASGTLRPGDRVRIQPGGRESQVARIVGWSGDLPLAVAGQSVMVTLADDIDVARGDMLSAATAPAEVADQFECTLVWMTDEPLLPGRRYLLKIGSRTVGASVTTLKYRMDVKTLAHIAARQLTLNEIGIATLALERPYRRARRGELVNFTGIDSPYGPPQEPELRLDTQVLSVIEAAERVLKARGWLQSPM